MGRSDRPDRDVTGMTVVESSDKVIRTERLVLRPLRAGDDARIFALFANWNVVRYLSSPPWPYAADDARTFVSGLEAVAPQARHMEQDIRHSVIGQDKAIALRDIEPLDDARDLDDGRAGLVDEIAERV